MREHHHPEMRIIVHGFCSCPALAGQRIAIISSNLVHTLLINYQSTIRLW